MHFQSPVPQLSLPRQGRCSEPAMSLDLYNWATSLLQPVLFSPERQPRVLHILDTRQVSEGAGGVEGLAGASPPLPPPPPPGCNREKFGRVGRLFAVLLVLLCLTESTFPSPSSNSTLILLFSPNSGGGGGGLKLEVGGRSQGHPPSL